MTKTDVIGKILKLTNREGNIEAYEKLSAISEKSDTYLPKYLKVVEKLSKANV